MISPPAGNNLGTLAGPEENFGIVNGLINFVGNNLKKSEYVRRVITYSHYFKDFKRTISREALTKVYKVILLSGFQKKTQKTPQKEIEKAERLMNEYLEKKHRLHKND